MERATPEGWGEDDELLVEEGGKTLADELLDELMPPEFDWRGVVRRHPIPAILVAAAAGYWIGRSRRGVALAEAAGGALALGLTTRLAGAGLELDDDAALD